MFKSYWNSIIKHLNDRTLSLHRRQCSRHSTHIALQIVACRKYYIRNDVSRINMAVLQDTVPM